MLGSGWGEPTDQRRLRKAIKDGAVRRPKESAKVSGRAPIGVGKNEQGSEETR